MIRLEKNHRLVTHHFERVKAHLISNINHAISSGAIIKKKHYFLTPKEIRYLEFIKKEVNLKKLVTADNTQFEEISKWFRRINTNVGNTTSAFNRVLYNIFIINLYEKTDRFNKTKFIQKINIDTCPYCNRNYIYVLSKKGKVKPEIDHFLPKSKYPYFGISFFNLIPSCQTCNGKAAKGELDPFDENMISPYEIEHDDFEFSYKLISIDALSPLNGKSGVTVSINKNAKIDGNNRVFKLSKLYSKHEDHALELIIKSKVKYGEKARNYLNSYRGMKFSDSEINRMIVGNYTNIEDLHKRPLSKMYRDIAIKEGLI